MRTHRPRFAVVPRPARRASLFGLIAVTCVLLATAVVEGKNTKAPLTVGVDSFGNRQAGKESPVTADTLFDFIDGGAEVYRSFNVQRVVSRRYGRTGAPDLMADLFDMGSSRDAFGAYHHDIRDGKELAP